MQLYTHEGFRGIHCKSCGRQERCLYNECQCGTVWHQCLKHRVDPPVHASRKGIKKVKAKKQKGKVRMQESSMRKAPNTEPKKETTNTRRQFCRIGKAKTLQRHFTIKASTNPPRAEMVARIRRKVEKAKLERTQRIERRTNDGEQSLQKNGAPTSAASNKVSYSKGGGEFDNLMQQHRTRKLFEEGLRAKIEVDKRRKLQNKAEYKNDPFKNSEACSSGGRSIDRGQADDQMRSNKLACPKNSKQGGEEARAIARLLQIKRTDSKA